MKFNRGRTTVADVQLPVADKGDHRRGAHQSCVVRLAKLLVSLRVASSRVSQPLTLTQYVSEAESGPKFLVPCAGRTVCRAGCAAMTLGQWDMLHRGQQNSESGSHLQEGLGEGAVKSACLERLRLHLRAQEPSSKAPAQVMADQKSAGEGQVPAKSRELNADSDPQLPQPGRQTADSATQYSAP